uniref:Katanin p60 ATPase-containing subunit A-like 2 n=1 Tax=Denticeps clupeoides TaxID=299321 RepID=A0AAY4AG36_9TELE
MELSYQAIKTAHQAREADEMRTEARRRNLLVLIHHHLTEEGYVATANALDLESNFALRRFEVCDNMDLDTVLMEYESYYLIKFQKYPKLTKKSPEQGSALFFLQENGLPLSVETAEFGLNVSPVMKNGVVDGGLMKKVRRYVSVFYLTCVRFSPTQERLLKPTGALGGMNSEMRDLATVISQDIYLHNPNVRWDDIIGLEAAKRLVKEAVVYPIKYPQLFTGILSPWKGLLLYGPPGTGKTMLAKAVATECHTTFFNISASSIVSKWRGDSEKLVRVLFELARFHAPSTIFLDELDSVMGQRGSGPGGEHEGSRRMKTELLVQMDGLSRSDDLVFVLAASNLPWELDHAMLRRLEKRILVGMPSEPARKAMIAHWLPPLSNTGGVDLSTDLDYDKLAEETEGYSGSDIKLVCKEAAMRPVRKIFDALENHQEGNANMLAIRLETVTTADFLEVIAHTKPSARTLTEKYCAWEQEYESV